MNQARCRAIDRLRFEQRKKRVDPERDSPLPTTGPSASEDIVAFVEQARLLREALTVLTPEERQTIETVFLWRIDCRREVRPSSIIRWELSRRASVPPLRSSEWRWPRGCNCDELYG